jgi:glycosyltransferase involved in cell wall biosynthesis
MKSLKYLGICKKIVREGLKKTVRQYTNFWKPYSRLFLISDSPLWSISHDMRELSVIARKLNVRLSSPRIVHLTNYQSIFLGSHFELFLNDIWFSSSHRLATAYFHGKPGTGFEEFDKCYEQLCRWHQRIARLQVSNKDMMNVLLESGISPSKVHRIPIGINLKYFNRQTPESHYKARLKHKIPQSAVVVGSFQKDGIGWGEGIKPKMIKGPDVFIETIKVLKGRIPELFVLLSGPARGYVKAELEKTGIPYKHCFLKRYSDIGELYQALDLYIVTSRQEGGPKAVLESMASGVPIVSTRVGQAVDLINHGQNGWLADVEDVEELAHWAEYALQSKNDLQSILDEGRKTAKINSYESQIPLWQSLMEGFVRF